MATLADVLEYWFGSATDDLQVIEARANIWFGKDKRTDTEIKENFSGLVLQAGKEQLSDPELSPPLNRLARILLLDQFPRNMYRDSPKAFFWDATALRLSLAGLDSGDDLVLRPVEKVFLYLPLEHSEDLQHQNRSVELFRSLCASVPKEWRSAFSGFLDYAIRHQVIIQRFGRFPHRNQILRRESSAAEEEFLRQPNSSF